MQKKSQKNPKENYDALVKPLAAILEPIDQGIRYSLKGIILTLGAGLVTAGAIVGLLFALFKKGKIGFYIFLATLATSIGGYFYLTSQMIK